MAVTLGNVGAGSTLVATPSTTTLATKSVSAGSGIELTASSTDISMASSITEVCIVSLTLDTTLTSSSTITIPFTTEILDPSAMHSTTVNTERINILSNGLYLVAFNSSWASAATTGGPLQHIVQYWDNSGSAFVAIAQSAQTAFVGTGIQRFSLSGVAYMEANDYVVATATNSTNVSKDLRSGSALSITKLSI